MWGDVASSTPPVYPAAAFGGGLPWHALQAAVLPQVALVLPWQLMSLQVPPVVA